LLIAILSIISVVSSYGQSQYSCDILTTVLGNESIVKELHLDKRNNSFVAIIDSNVFFSDCALSDLFGNKIEILSNTPNSFNQRMLYIEIVGVTQKKKCISVTLSVKSRGRYGNVILKRRANSYKVDKVRLGEF